jgi:hypothetical protein
MLQWLGNHDLSPKERATAYELLKTARRPVHLGAGTRYRGEILVSRKKR